MPCSAEETPALFTVMRPLSTVGKQMLGKAWFCDWREVASFALIWLFYGMCFDVIFKSACLWTRIIALWAFVWFLPTLFISYDLCICMIDALPLFCKSRLGGECDLCCFFYGYSQPCYSLLEASSINKLVHSQLFQRRIWWNTVMTSGALYYTRLWRDSINERPAW